MSEIAVASTWVVDTLSGQLTGVSDRIYGEIMPKETTYPAVLFQQMPSDDIMGVGPVRFMSRIEMSIRVVTKGPSYGAIETPAEEMDVLLHGQKGSNAYGAVLACVRRYPLKYAEVFDSVEYLYLGGVYRLDIQKV